MNNEIERLKEENERRMRDELIESSVVYEKVIKDLQEQIVANNKEWEWAVKSI